MAEAGSWFPFIILFYESKKYKEIFQGILTLSSDVLILLRDHTPSWDLQRQYWPVWSLDAYATMCVLPCRRTRWICWCSRRRRNGASRKKENVWGLLLAKMPKSIFSTGSPLIQTPIFWAQNQKSKLSSLFLTQSPEFQKGMSCSCGAKTHGGGRFWRNRVLSDQGCTWEAGWSWTTAQKLLVKELDKSQKIQQDPYIPSKVINFL